MDIKDIRPGSTVLIEATYRGVTPSDHDTAVLALYSGARTEVPVRLVKQVIKQPMQPGDTVRWDHPEAGSEQYWSGKFVDFLASDDTRAVVNAGTERGDIVIDAVRQHLRHSDPRNPTCPV